jgi:predicted TIM-barrel fold metal-dependent hydrolase
VTRIEPLIEEARNVTNNVQDLEEAFRALLEEAAQDPRCVAFKSVIAYRTGLDVGSPSRDKVALSYRRWKEAEWRDGRETSKDLRDHLLNVTFEIASRVDRPVHIHTGAGDADVVLAYARPSNLAALLMRFSAHPVVLIHSGYPWLEEATYLASIYPMAYLELSLTLSWPTLDIDRGLNLILGSVPTSKVLYGSDTSFEPEVLWISAKLARAALGRVLGCAVERNYLTQKEAERVGRSVLAGNVIRLHGLTD